MVRMIEVTEPLEFEWEAWELADYMVKEGIRVEVKFKKSKIGGGWILYREEK